MKKTLLFTLFLVLGTVFCGTAQTTPTKETKTTTDTPSPVEVSKALGILYATMFKDMVNKAPGGSEFDPDIVISTMQDILLNKKEPSYDRATANTLLNNFFKEKQEELNSRTRAESAKFLEENAKKEGVKTTKSGLQYLITKEGKGVHPTVEDTVLVHYQGMLIDGTEFDSSIKRGEPVKFNLLQVIPGWTEGLCLLNKGAKARLFIPYNLAYGERGMGDIPPYSTLIFDIELLDVIKGEPIPLASTESDKPQKKQEAPKEKK